jgi:hypothetical protein
MGSTRTIKRVIRSRPTIEGAGVHLKRAFGFHEAPHMDPFLLLDDFHSARPDEYLPGFPWHPHRGIETITYVLRGRVEHGDSLGNSGVINPGDVQWMTAGSGIIHQEMPKGDKDDQLWGFQLWANLPADHKMMDPGYRGLTSGEIPEVKLDRGVRVKVICGVVNGVRGPVRGIVTDPTYLDVIVSPRSSFSQPTTPGHQLLTYVIDGDGAFDEKKDPYAFEAVGRNYFDLERSSQIGPEHLVVYHYDGDEIRVTAGDRGVRFLLFSGRPIGEPVAWYGPIVMNTQEELRVAFEEYRNGTFVKDQSHRQNR